MSLPPPIRKLMNLRSSLNAGEVSVPVEASPLWNELASPLPLKPSTGICFGKAPLAGPAPNASPVTCQLP